HDIGARKIVYGGIAKFEMIAALITHRKRADAGNDVGFAQGQVAGSVVQQLVPASLSLKGERKRGVAGDVDALDRIHLDCDGERHGGRQLIRRFSASSASVASLWKGSAVRAACMQST